MLWFFQKIWLPLYGRWGLWYIGKERSFGYAGLRVKVPPGVFHPGLFFSSTIFIDFLQHVDFQEKKVLDVGTGSGFLALFAAQKGAMTTAIDVNPLAVKTCLKNAEENRLSIRVFESDLFDQIPVETRFDYMLINPPYFATAPKDTAAKAFFAGENLEYFEKLFRQMPAFIHADTKVWMILSDDCDLDKIHSIAKKHGFSNDSIYHKTRWSKRLLIEEYKYRAYATSTGPSPGF